MATKKISQLVELTVAAANDEFIIRDDSEVSGDETKRISFSNLQPDMLNHATALEFTIGYTGQVKIIDGALVPVTTNDIDLGSESSALRFKNLSLASAGIFYRGAVEQGKDVTSAINRKIVEIGTWDMDTTTNVNVAHGVSGGSNIRDISVVIQNDAETTFYKFPMCASYSQQGHLAWDGTYVYLYRLLNGTFDSTTFNSTSINRGWVTISYLA